MFVGTFRGASSRRRACVATALFIVVTIAGAHAAGNVSSPAWMNASLSPDARATLVVQAMTLDEKISLLHGHAPFMLHPLPAGFLLTSGYVPGVPRLGIPALGETDAGLGVTAPSGQDEGSTVLPSGLAQAATWNPAIAYDGGAMIGHEAHSKGFNVLLAGGLNLQRDPRNGRNFEYAGEDPLLAGAMVGEEIRGIQDQHVVSTTKHFALNDQETGRTVLNALIDEAAFRESDLLAFEIAIERGKPGAVMTAYNLVDGFYASENSDLLTKILKSDWNYSGWTMSDWGGTHSTEAAALAGLDQESGEEYDGRGYFGEPLKQAVLEGTVPPARIDEMVHRILRSMFANGLVDFPATPVPIDFDADAQAAQNVEEQAIVLLRNQGNILPLANAVTKIAVIGGHSDIGVLGGGGGSSEVTPHGGPALRILASRGEFPVFEMYIASSPLKAIAARVPQAQVDYADGSDRAAAGILARNSDVAIVFATQWTSESVDAPDISLPGEQDALIDAVAAANPHTIVVLETGGPVAMPWRDKVAAILEAWYSGSRGGEAVARVIFGEINPSGRLPATFPQSEAQLPRRALPGSQKLIDLRAQPGEEHAQLPGFDVSYFEGSKVGYRWYESRKLTPLYPFGFGLSYASFSYSKLMVAGGKTLKVSFDVTNTGARAGMDTPQLYVAKQLGTAESIHHLAGWSKIALSPGETHRVSIAADPRLLATFDTSRHAWTVAGGVYKATIGRFAGDVQLTGGAPISAQSLRP